MNYRGLHRKYIEGSSQYTVYVYGDVVKRNGKFYVCKANQTSGYIPEDANSGFDVLSFYEDPSPNGPIDGGTY
jgi:hypothetical protein